MKGALLSLGFVVGLLAVAAESRAQLSVTAPRAVVELRLEINQKEVLASAVLVHREDGPQGVVLYFLTSERLLHPGILAAPAPQFDEDGRSPWADATLNIAVIRILIGKSALVPADVALDPLREGAPFFIVAPTADGGHTVVPQRIRRMSARSATGDGEMPTARCVGAPAFGERGVFGIVSECTAGAPPTIALLSAARGLLGFLIPGLDLGWGGSLRSGNGN